MKVKDIIEVNVEVKLRETFTVTTIMTEKKNVENQAVSVCIMLLLSVKIVCCYQRKEQMTIFYHFVL